MNPLIGLWQPVSTMKTLLSILLAFYLGACNGSKGDGLIFAESTGNSRNSTSQKIKVILDSDIGGDIDDVLALAFAVKLPQLEVLGLTLAYDGNLRAPIASKMLKLLGREDIPVALGSPVKLIQGGQAGTGADAPQMKMVGNIQGLKSPIEQHAVDFIISKVMSSRDGEITLLPYGPLTNIAMAITKEPRILRKIRQIVLMGGALSRSYPEYNIKCDPEAAYTVFASGAPIVMVGLDVTLKCQMRQEQVEAIRRLGREDTDQIYRFIEAWQEGNRKRMPVLHDPLAVAVVVDPSLVKTEKMLIDVEIDGKLTSGATVPRQPSERSQLEKIKTWVCREVDADRFLKLFMETILR